MNAFATSVLEQKNGFSFGMCRTTFAGTYGLHQWDQSRRSSQSNCLLLFEVRTVVQAMSTADEQHIRREDWGCCAVCPALVLDGI